MVKNICEVFKKSFLAPGSQYNKSNFSPWVIWIFKGHRAVLSQIMDQKGPNPMSFLAPKSQIQPVKARKLEFKSALIWSARYSREYASDKFFLIQWLVYYHLKPPSAKKNKFQCGTEKSADLEGSPPKQHVLGSGGSENEPIQKIPTRGGSTNLT